LGDQAMGAGHRIEDTLHFFSGAGGVMLAADGIATRLRSFLGRF